MAIARSFSKRLILNILAIVIALFVVVLGVIALFSHLIIDGEVNRNAKNTLNASISRVSSTLQSVEATVQSSAWVVKQNLHNPDFLYEVTQQIVAANPIIIGSAIAFDSNYYAGHHHFAPYACVGASGEIHTFQLGTTYNDYFNQQWYTLAQQRGKPIWSDLYYDDGGAQQLMTTYSYPIYDTCGRFIAVITADIPLQWIQHEVDSIRPYKNSYTIFVASNGNYLATGKQGDHTYHNIIASTAATGDTTLIQMAERMLAGESGSVTFHYDHNHGFAVYSPLPNGWSAVIFSHYDDVFQRTFQMYGVLILVGLLGIILVFYICRRRVQHLTRPLTEFSRSALDMAKGNLHAQLPEIQTQDEMRHLRDSFAYMQHSLINYIHELRITTRANERMESELSIARNIQLGMLPTSFPDNDESALFACLVPAKEVGGDFYDFILKEGRLSFTIGDVAGKGVPAALVMSILRASWHFFAAHALPAHTIVKNLNTQIAEGNDLNMFATLFTATIDLQRREMTYCNAGHNPIIVIPPDPNSNPYFLKAQTHIAIGVTDEFPFQCETLTLERGTRLLLYTDGISEAENVAKEIFGSERLLQTVSQPDFRQLSPQQMTEHLYEKVKAFSGANEQSDDLTILAILLK